MIKKYKQYNESIKHLLVGPTSEEVFKNLHLDKLSPDDMLRKSVELGILDGVKLAIEKGADVHYGNDLLLAKSCDSGHYDIVEYALSLGLNRWINVGLKYACQHNNIDIIELLLDNGADIHFDNEYCLKISVQYYYFDLTKFLLKRGANIHATNDWVIRFVNDGRKSGYTKFKNLFNKILSTNEGIRHLLVGPTKEEVWKNKGYSDIMKTPPDTAKEFLEMILDDITIVNQRKYRKSVFYKRNGEIYFELEHNNQTLWVNYSKVWLILVNYYGLTGWDLKNIISKITQKKLEWPNYNIKESDRLPDGFWESIYELGEKNDRELNEGIKSLLVGPSKEEIWKHYGYDKPFGTPEEFMEYISDNLEKIVKHNTFSDIIYWKYKPQNEVYFEYNSGTFFYSKERIYDILEGVFNMKPYDIFSLFKNHLINKLKIESNSINSQKKHFWRDIK